MTERGRELIQRRNSKTYVHRDARGRFQKIVDAGDSLGRDVRQRAATEVKGGQGDRGDQRRD